ncbi:MAG: Vms1/Ankzf1 family peptidyl-tRNA hydrolase [Candidatus Binatia bacterium]
MISRQDLERLTKLKTDHGILTAYIRLDPRLRFVRQQAASQFKGALKVAQRRIQEGRWRDALERESSHVLNFLSGWEPSGRGLVIFSCRPEALWEVLSLEILVPNLVDVDTTTKTGILAGTLEEFPRFVVAVLQKDKARIYIAEQGTSEEQVAFTSDVPGQHKQGGRSQMRFQRHIDFHVAEHRKKVADEIAKLAETGALTLALGGTDEIVNEMVQTLPEPIARMVIGRFPVDYKHDTEQQILERAELVWKNREQFEEIKLVDQVFDAAKSGMRGVLGIESTLSALVEEKISCPRSSGMALALCAASSKSWSKSNTETLKLIRRKKSVDWFSDCFANRDTDSSRARTARKSIFTKTACRETSLIV